MVYTVLGKTHVDIRGTRRHRAFEDSPQSWRLLGLEEYETVTECPDVALGQAVMAALMKVQGYAGDLDDYIRA